MKRLIAWFVENPVAANLLMAALVVGGLLLLPNIRQEEFPNLEVPAVNVTVPYLGAAPEEVEEGVCLRIEEALDGMPGIDRMNTTAGEGSCTVGLQLLTGHRLCMGARRDREPGRGDRLLPGRDREADRLSDHDSPGCPDDCGRR